jgi:hypothetical protein
MCCRYLTFNLGICKYDIPRGEWPNIMPIIISAASHEHMNYRMSAILSIGYISQEVHSKNFSIEEINQCISALIENLNYPELEMQKTSAQSLIYFMGFTFRSMRVDAERNFIVGGILKALESQSLEMRVLAMQNCVEMARLYYDELKPHIPDLINSCKQRVISFNLDVE